jgi:hypothetical protein
MSTHAQFFHILYNEEVAASTQAYVPYTWSYFTSVLQTSIWPTDLDCSSYHNWLLLLTLVRNQSRLADNYADLKTFCLHTIKWTLLLTDYAPSISTNHPWVKLQHWAHQNHFWTQKAQTDRQRQKNPVRLPNQTQEFVKWVGNPCVSITRWISSYCKRQSRRFVNPNRMRTKNQITRNQSSPKRYLL